jgi:hypothetical protein
MVQRVVGVYVNVVVHIGNKYTKLLCEKMCENNNIKITYL